MIGFLVFSLVFYILLTLPASNGIYSVIQPFSGGIGSILGALAIGIVLIVSGLICIEYFSLRNHIKLRQIGASDEELEWQFSNCTLKVQTLIQRIDDGMDVCKVYIQSRKLELFGVVFLVMYLLSSYLQNFIAFILCI